jgi:hypothetical protein
MPIPGLHDGGITAELKLRLKFYCYLACCFLFCFVFCLLFQVFCCCFCLFCSVNFLFLFLILLSFFFLYFQFYHHYVLIPTLMPFNLPSSPVLKSISVLPNNSFCTFSPTLSPCHHLPSHSPPTCHQTTPTSHTLIPHWPIYYTNFTQSQLLQSLIQAPSITTTEIHTNTHKDHKNQQSLYCFPYHPPHFWPPF